MPITRQCDYCNGAYSTASIRVSQELRTNDNRPAGNKYMRLFCSEICGARWLTEHVEAIPVQSPVSQIPKPRSSASGAGGTTTTPATVTYLNSLRWRGPGPVDPPRPPNYHPFA